MKAIILLILLNIFYASLSFAEDCKVGGISDSPQNISCFYKDGWTHHMQLNISCENGKYVFTETANGSPAGNGKILSAYHEDVQSGMSPLVFKMDDTRSLRITKALGLFFRGELVNDNGTSGSNGTFRCKVR